MKNSSPAINSRIAVAVLAAGSASRFGGGKLDAKLRGTPLGLWATKAAERAGFTQRIVVTAQRAPEFVSVLTGWEQVVNPAPSEGIASSIRTAVGAARSCQRLILILGDMPFIDADHLRGLAEGVDIIYTVYPNGRKGVPAAFPARCFSRLRALKCDQGAAAIDWQEISFSMPPRSADSLIDVDTLMMLRFLNTE